MVATHPALAKYREPFSNLTPGDMSADETDDENPGPTKRFIRGCPFWRADECSGICWRADDLREDRKWSSVADWHRCAMGPQPLQRVHIARFTDEKAPRGLPINWYRYAYIDTLTEEELYDLEPGEPLL